MTASVEQQMAAPVATVPGGGGAGLLDPLWRSGGGRGWERCRGGWRCYGTGREGVVLCGGMEGGSAGGVGLRRRAVWAVLG